MSTDSDTVDTRSEAAVNIEDVSVTFRSKRKTVTALENINMRVLPGEFVSIAGPSGCGKSTLLKVVAGLTRRSSGEVEIQGDRISGPRQDIGYVFQTAQLLEWRSAEANILLQAEMRGMDRKAARERCAELMSMVGLEGFEKAMPHELSGGMQQRVSLCRALLHRPRILLMDEPFGALDALTREKMNIELNRIWRETGTTVLLVTHSVAEAVYLGTRVMVMSSRPGTVLEELDVPIAPSRDYNEVMQDPGFTRVAGRVRELLGSKVAAD